MSDVKKKGFFAGCGTLLLAALLVGTCLSVMRKGEEAEAERADDFAKAEAVKVTAAALVDAYKANSIAADRAYNGKKLEVTGIIEAIDSDTYGRPVVRLTGRGLESVHVKGLARNTAATFTKGYQLTVVCRGGGEVLGSPMLSDCEMK